MRNLINMVKNKTVIKTNKPITNKKVRFIEKFEVISNQMKYYGKYGLK